MAQPAQPESSKPLPPPPEEASTSHTGRLGQKVKSLLHGDQESSVRILRGPSSNHTPRNGQPPTQSSGPNGSHTTPPVAVPTQSSESTGVNGFGSRIRSIFGGREGSQSHDGSSDSEYDQDTVDVLDVVDPEVSTLATLTNVQNSLFIPSVGKIINRRPVYRLSDRYGEPGTIDKLKAALARMSKPSISPISNLKYAILPDGETLEGWTPAETEELDDNVRHMLHSRRAKFKRAMKGFGQYVRRPLGLFVTVYATLITLFGAAWVLFLIGWISVGSKKDYVVNVVDNVLVALFAIIGDGLAPFRAVDTYHMIYIAHYHRKTYKRRESYGLTDLADHNDLPEQRKEDVEPVQVDIESLVARKMPRRLARVVAPRIPARYAQRIISRNTTIDQSQEYSVLTPEEQTKLEFHERKFSKSHTFYKPHETKTHFAFPIKLLVAVVVLLDCHSCLQITLGACTWGIPYQHRPFALTTVILCMSITCNILGGVLISVGDKRTRKKDVIERMMRQELTSEAMRAIEKRLMEEAEARGELDKSVRKNMEEEREQKENEEIKKAWKVVPTLPKQLLGKGEDHRQPSLPQSARTSNSSLPSTSNSSHKNPKSKGNAGLPAVPEDPIHPLRSNLQQPQRAEDPLKEGRGQKAMRFIRRADMDRS